jgi:hypothetical protein
VLRRSYEAGLARFDGIVREEAAASASPGGRRDYLRRPPQADAATSRPAALLRLAVEKGSWRRTARSTTLRRRDSTRARLRGADRAVARRAYDLSPFIVPWACWLPGAADAPFLQPDEVLRPNRRPERPAVLCRAGQRASAALYFLRPWTGVAGRLGPAFAAGGVRTAFRRFAWLWTRAALAPAPDRASCLAFFRRRVVCSGCAPVRCCCSDRPVPLAALTARREARARVGAP